MPVKSNASLLETGESFKQTIFNPSGSKSLVNAAKRIGTIDNFFTRFVVRKVLSSAVIDNAQINIGVYYKKVVVDW